MWHGDTKKHPFLFLTELQKPVKKIAITLHNQGSTFHVNYERKRQ
jgi:hypothetical protein